MDETTISPEAPSGSTPGEPSWRKSLPALIIGGLIGGLVLVVALVWLEPSLRSLPPGRAFQVGLLAMGLAGLYGVLVVHECGHLLAGWLVGFRFQLFTLGPLRLQRDESGRIRPGLNRDLAMYGGAALALPTDAQDLRRRYAWFAAGGPLMSFTLAALLMVPPMVAPGTVGATARVGLLGIGLVSAAIGLVTAIPTATGTFVSDGMRVVRFLKGGPLAERDAALVNLMALGVANIPPRDWDKAVVESSLVPADGSSSECQARWFAYLSAIDLGDEVQAGEHLDRMMTLMTTLPRSVAPLMFAEAAYYEGWWRGRADESRRWLERLPVSSSLLPDYERLRAEAASAAALGERTRARTLTDDALRAVPSHAVWVHDRLIEMRVRLQDP